MLPFGTPKGKKSGSSGGTPQKQAPATSTPGSSLVPCPMCQKSIPQWMDFVLFNVIVAYDPERFVNNHLDHECSGMENVAESLTQHTSKRKQEEMDDDFEDLDESSFLQDDEESNEDFIQENPPREHILNPFITGPNRLQTHQKPQQQQQPQQQQKLQRQQPQEQQTFQSRKDKANAVVQRSMPLAERARPTNLDDYIGQKDLVGPGGMLRALVLQDTVPSIVLWGPCGVGKTTLARIIAHSTKSQFKELSATTHGVADVRKVFEDAKNLFQLTRQRTIVFLDEIHRFTKAQQDIFLPFVEKGTITLIGATTENPSFRINSALLSRCRVLTLEKLSLEDGMDRMIRRAARIKWRDILEIAQDRMSPTEMFKFVSTIGKDEQSIDNWIDGIIEPGAIKWLIDLSDGDGRSAINTLEIAIQGLSTLILSSETECENDGPSSQAVDTNTSGILENLLSVALTAESIKSAFQKTHLQYDRQGDEHYNLISALHKSVRGGDADAALYWLGRMLVAGEEPLYIARRLVRMASEDIGMADSSALPLAVATYQACQMIGMPECDVNLAHCVVYLAKAKKSVDVYKAYGLVKQTVSEEFAYPVPIHLRNAPTTLMKELGYGEEYKYNPSYPEGVKVDQEYFPKGIKKRKFLGEFPVMKLGEDGEWHF
ncbi:Werner helicase interacting protein 1 [Mortierella sp. AM989]|nr:Werner helicase interacting protein 1 [Mortierella sp. AM989]